jgi:hypothetical protein
MHTHALARMHTYACTRTHTRSCTRSCMHPHTRMHPHECAHAVIAVRQTHQVDMVERVRIPKPDGKPMSARRSFDVARCSRAFGVPVWYTDSVRAAVSKGVSAWRSSRCDTTAISMRRITTATRLFTTAFSTRESFGMGWGPLQRKPLERLLACDTVSTRRFPSSSRRFRPHQPVATACCRRA